MNCKENLQRGCCRKFRGKMTDFTTERRKYTVREFKL